MRVGLRSIDPRANYLNRYRVRVGLRSIDPRATDTVLVFCGGAVGSVIPEAELLLRYARDRRGYAGPYEIERDSRTTLENVGNVIGLLDGFDTVKIASDSLHAERARAYLWRLRPDLGRRLVAADDYRFGELPLVKPVAAVLGVGAVRRLQR